MRGVAVLHGTLLVAACLAAPGCGALMHGSTTQIAVASRPTGAHAWVDGLYVGVTPIRVMLPSREPHELVVRAEGFQERRVQLQPRVTEGYIVMDASFGFPWSLMVDWFAGALVDTSPGRIRVRLQPGETPATSPSPSPSTSTSTSASTSTTVPVPGEPTTEPLRPPGY